MVVVRRSQAQSPVLEHCEFIAGAAGPQRDEALARLLRTHRLDAMPCSSVVALDDYVLLLVEAPEVPPAELRAAMRWRVKDLIDYPVEQAVIDVFDVPAGREARTARVVWTVVARSATVDERVSALQRTGFKPSVIDIPELALRNLAALLPEDVGGAALVYIGPERGFVTITRQGVLYLTRRIDASTTFLGQETSAALSERMEGWLDAIAVEIQRSVDYYESHFGQPPVAGVVLAPLGRRISGFAEYLSRQLGLRTRCLDLNEIIEARTPIEDAVQPHCVTALGAALRTAEDAAA